MPSSVVDSVPVHANVNFARANVLPTLDEAQIESLFTDLDLIPVEEVLTARGIKITKKRKYPIDALIRSLCSNAQEAFSRDHRS